MTPAVAHWWLLLPTALLSPSESDSAVEGLFGLFDGVSQSPRRVFRLGSDKVTNRISPQQQHPNDSRACDAWEVHRICFNPRVVSLSNCIAAALLTVRATNSEFLLFLSGICGCRQRLTAVLP